MWIVTRYDDIRALLADPRFSSEGGTWGSEEFRAAGLVSGAGSLLEKSVTVVDPPAHTRLRRLAMSAFTPRRIAQWRGTVTDLVESTLDECARRTRIDVMADYAGVVSSTVMGQILGLRIDRHDELVEALAQAFPSDPERMGDVATGFTRICDYAAELVHDKRRRPADDLVSALVQAREDGDRLDEDELVAMVAAMILAGSDTIRAFVGNATLALLDHPDQRALLVARPETAPAAVEELLRYEGALSTALFRVTTEELEFAGTRLPAGAPVIAALLSGNRDPRRFTDPDRLDLTRTDGRHLGLGHGLHNCLGGALARLESEIAVPALFRRFPRLSLGLPREEVGYIDNWAMRRIVSLPVDLA
ncbi:cytochrome P450 [Streptomyces sp. NPDC090306]|uniref:cytochrome P450 n=1 Tax=unclassified Streptomyces TaxID=2593676 RepID=UPI0036EB42C7